MRKTTRRGCLGDRKPLHISPACEMPERFVLMVPMDMASVAIMISGDKNPSALRAELNQDYGSDGEDGDDDSAEHQIDSEILVQLMRPRRQS